MGCKAWSLRVRVLGRGCRVQGFMALGFRGFRGLRSRDWAFALAALRLGWRAQGSGFGFSFHV